jgi:hypothetical protein
MKRTKKYNPRKSLDSNVDKVKDWVCFGWVPGMKAPKAFIRTTGTPFDLPANVHNYIMGNPQHWTIACLVVCRRPHLEPYIRILDVSSKGPVIHRAIAEELNDVHKDLIKGVNDDHVICASWILVPKYLKDDELLSGKMVDSIMTQLGAWKLLSGWEWKNVKEHVS